MRNGEKINWLITISVMNDKKKEIISAVVDESIKSLQTTKEYYGDKWILSDFRSCERWLKGYFIGMEDKKGYNMAVDILKEKIGNEN